MVVATAALTHPLLCLGPGGGKGRKAKAAAAAVVRMGWRRRRGGDLCRHVN